MKKNKNYFDKYSWVFFTYSLLLSTRKRINENKKKNF